MSKTTNRSIGALGAAFMLVGNVIGVSIFILPGALAASTGPAVVLSYLIASIMAIFSCVVAAQIGTVFPVSGASYVVVREALHKYFSFILVWVIVGAGAMGMALLSYGFADYLGVLFPSVDHTFFALGIICLLTLVNLRSANEVVYGQNIIVIAFMFSLTLFCFAALGEIRISNLSPFMPNGWDPVLSASVAAFFSYSGFMVIIEIGGDIKNPERNIPRAIAIAFLIVLIAYSLVSFIVVGVIDWHVLSGISTPINEVAIQVLPSWGANIITYTAIAAAVTSVNVLLLVYSRDVSELAKDKLLPGFFARPAKDGVTPVGGVLSISFLSFIAIMFDEKITTFATLTVVGIMIFQVLLGISMLKLSSELVAHHGSTAKWLNLFSLKFFNIGLILMSLLFLFIVVKSNIMLIVVMFVYIILGSAVYTIFQRQIIKKGYDGC